MGKYHGRPCNKCGKTEEEGAVFGWRNDKRIKAGGYWRGECTPCHTKRNIAHNAKYPEKQAKRGAKLMASWSDAERIARASVAYAISKRGDLTTEEMYGGLSHSEAVAMTTPFAEKRLRLEAETGVPHNIHHKLSLSLGGLHTKDNLEVISEKENMAMGNCWFEDEMNSPKEKEAEAWLVANGDIL